MQHRGKSIIWPCLAREVYPNGNHAIQFVMIDGVAERNTAIFRNQAAVQNPFRLATPFCDPCRCVCGLSATLLNK
jgi:hypothetical protein